MTSDVLSYAVYRLDVGTIQGSDDWFDECGRLKYKEEFLYKILKDASVIEKDSWLIALFASEQDAIEFCAGAGLDSSSDYFYYCLKMQAEVELSEGEYVEVGY
ncbi:hypothetical protein [Campylobacter curvus]|uniref:hypothetical protein n=1 Tax=Campylobacter curvus TaxID=200 RepID=UPI00146FFE52|nr:hypothetical protein [Campylobacter curvus]